MKHAGEITDITFSPDGHRLVTSSRDHTAQVWNAETGKPVVQSLRHLASVEMARFSPDGQRIVTASIDGSARIWAARTSRQPLAMLLVGQPCGSAQFSRDGSRIVTVSAEGAMIWDAVKGTPLSRRIADSNQLHSAEFSLDGRNLLTASYGGSAQVWHGVTGAPVTLPLRHRGGVNSASFSPNGRLIASVGSDGARVWDAVTGEPVIPLFRGDAPSIVFSPDSSRFAVCSWGGHTRILDMRPVNRNYSDLALLGLLLSGERLDRAAGPVPATLSKLRQAWKTLRYAHPQDFTPSNEVARDWEIQKLNSSAVRAEQLRDWNLEIAHMNRMIRLDPAEYAHRTRRGFAFAELEKWKAAGDDYERAIKLGAPNHAWNRRAMARLGQQDTSQYRIASGEMFARFGGSADQWDCFWLAWTHCVSPYSGGNANLIVQIAERALRTDPKNPQFLQAAGASLYRAGRFAESITRSNECAAAQIPPQASLAYPRFFLAMAHARLRNVDEARKWLSEAIKQAESELTADPPPAWNRRLTLQLLRREAESVVNGKTP